MVALVKHDLEFILKQIKIAEAHANGIPLTEIRLNAAGQVITDRAWYTSAAFDSTLPLAIPDAKTPFGLRTVDGSYNNIVEGREHWGAADQPMPRLLNPNFINEGDDSMALGGGQTVTNNDYGTVGTPTPGANGGHSGNVVDADPRLISNLIADMSFNNPAAIVAALTFAGSADVYADLAVVRAAHATLISTIVAINADPGLDEAAKQAGRDAAQADFDLVLEAKGIEAENGSIVLPNVAADEGLTAPFNSWMTFFGQFFDHGLDLITKTDNGTIYIPLAPDDPLRTHGADGIPGTGDEVGPQNAFMVLSRATPVAGPGADGVLGTADDTSHEAVNVTTPFVDQNQTYTSHPSHQVFLREYATVNGKTVATGHLLDGVTGGLGTWGDVKTQARTMLGIELSDQDVFNVPLLRTDPYGRFIPDPITGYAQVIVGLGADGTPNTADDIVISGTAANPINLIAMATTPINIGGVDYFGPIRTSHAFLDDIAHNAAPGSVFDADGNPATPGVLVVQADDDDVAGNAIATDFRGRKVAYDDELLDAHFATGDGRGNENIGLTAVHHVFHSEHNRQVEAQKLTILQSADIGFINEWLASDIAGLPSNFASLSALDQLAFANTLNWDGERLFQAARFATEMQYQHLVFEEFARQVQPLIDPFVFNSTTDINPSIFAEFAHTVYRFGHSMLTENIGLVDPGTGVQSEIGLIEAFLNPGAMNALGTADEATAAIVAGMTRVRGNEIDEFVTGALRNNLLGLPLDLPAINIARGRDAGIPSLNDARAQLYAATGSTFLEPYKNWVDFAANLKNPLSVVNFIAAYGTHATITGATTSADKRDAAWDLVFGVAGETASERAARIAWLNGPAATTGVNAIDLWIGGLAEKKMPFGGMLGSTFNAIFEAQLENLQDGDRFYYLTRTQGLNFLNQLEENSFSKLILKNSALSDPGPDGIRGTGDDIVDRHLGVNVFANYDFYLEVNAAMQLGADPTGNDPVLEGLGRGKVQRDDPLTAAIETNFLRFTGGEHVSVGGTSGADTIITDFGDDSVWGGAGNDRIESGAGVDLVNGGDGDDIITDSGDSGDFLKGEGGNDVIANSNGLDILMGGTGKDVFFVGVDDTEVFAGQGDDFILGGDGVDFLMGNEGDDWIEAGAGFDTTAGDNSELFFNSTIIGHDVMFAGSDEHDFDAESGDDIMVQGESVMRSEGMFGFDWATFQGANIDGYADMRIKIFTTEQQDILRNRFDKVEALSGWSRNDTLIGDDRTAAANDGPVGPITPDLVAANEGVFFNDELTQAGVNRIDGLRALLSDLIDTAPVGATAEQLEALVAFNSGNILLGGGGSDRLQGNGGDDVLDGDRWLNVRIRITAPDQANTAANEIGTITSLKHVFGTSADIPAAWQGKSVFQLMIDRVITPTQLHIVREVLNGGQTGDIDTAVFWDLRDNYEFTQAADGGIIVTHVTVTPGLGRVSDGVDRLYNIERLQFADVTLNTAGLFNTPAVGAPVISDTTPTQGQPLTLNFAAISDAQGINLSSRTIQWQVQLPDGSWADIPGATTATFTPGAGQVNQVLRAVVSFNDNAGNPEQVVSAPTTPVGLLYNGTGGANNVSGTLLGADIMNGLGGNDTLNGLGGDDLLNGGAGNDTLNGGNGADILNGEAGTDTLNGDAGDDTLSGGTGNDTLNGGAGDDTIIWNVGDGRDTINGGLEGPGGDTVVINGDASAETYHVWTRAAWASFSLANGLASLGLAPGVEIIVTRNGTNFASIITQMSEIEEIVIAGGGGGDTFVTHGDFAPTSLSTSTITLNGSAGNDVVDISGLQSSHRIVFRSLGGDDTIIGTLRSQDVLELPDGVSLQDCTRTRNANGSTTLSTGEHSITYFGNPSLGGDNPPPPLSNGAFDLPLDGEDIRDLLQMVRDGLTRDASGLGNNQADPTQANAGQPFIRLTDAYYTDGASGVRQTTLTPRQISDLISNQDNNGDGVEESTPNAFGGTALLTAFGQYFDHGLDFLSKGAPGSMPIGSPSFPITAPRGNIMPGTGIDPDGIPNNGDEIAARYINDTSPYVDQNQAYGSHEAITDLLRKWEIGPDGQPRQTAHLLSGGLDSTGRPTLPTLDDIRANYRIMTGGQELTAEDIANYDGTGQPLLIDFVPVYKTDPGTGQPILDLDAIGHYYVVGDGRGNENLMLTSIHTIWERNHNHWVDRLKESTNGAWTEEEYFQAARIMNIAEYQRVVFTEFAQAMGGGLGDDEEHGFEGYDPTVDASISLEFAQAAFRFGHSMLNETVSYVDANGALQQMSLVNAFLSPQTLASLGVDAILAGAAATPHQAIDVDVVNALRNQLVGRPLDLAALNIFRGRDVGIAPFNTVRADLFEQTGDARLRPYSGWDDFQARNQLSNAFITQLKAAYPEGFETMDLWVGGLAERPMHGQLGSTFGYIFLDQLNRLQHGDRLYYLEIFDDSIFQGNALTFSEIIMRNTGLTDLPEFVFQPDAPPQDDDDDVPDDDDDDDDIPGDDDDDDVIDDDDDDDDHVPDDDDDDDDDSVIVPPPAGVAGQVMTGTSANDQMTGGSGDDQLSGGSGDDVLHGGSGDDRLLGGSGDDQLSGGSGDDALEGGSGDDRLSGGSGDDMLNGGSGDDVLDGGSGDDILTGGSGDDIFVFGGGDHVTDFVMGQDRLDLSAMGVTAANFASQVSITSTAAGAAIAIGAQTLILEGVSGANLSSGAFILNGPIAPIAPATPDASLPTGETATPVALNPTGQANGDFLLAPGLALARMLDCDPADLNEHLARPLTSRHFHSDSTLMLMNGVLDPIQDPDDDGYLIS